MLKHVRNLSLLTDDRDILNKFNRLMAVINSAISDIYECNYDFYNNFFH